MLGICLKRKSFTTVEKYPSSLSFRDFIKHRYYIFLKAFPTSTEMIKWLLVLDIPMIHRRSDFTTVGQFFDFCGKTWIVMDCGICLYLLSLTILCLPRGYSKVENKCLNTVKTQIFGASISEF